MARAGLAAIMAAEEKATAFWASSTNLLLEALHRTAKAKVHRQPVSD